MRFERRDREFESLPRDLLRFFLRGNSFSVVKMTDTSLKYVGSSPTKRVRSLVRLSVWAFRQRMFSEN